MICQEHNRKKMFDRSSVKRLSNLWSEIVMEMSYDAAPLTGDWDLFHNITRKSISWYQAVIGAGILI